MLSGHKKIIYQPRATEDKTPKYTLEPDGVTYQFNGSQLKLFDFVKDQKYFDSMLPYAKSTGWFLPGHGSQKSDCGQIKAKVCNHVELHPEHKTLVRYYKRSCLEKSCPVCFEGWSSSESMRGLLRLASFVVSFGDVRHLQNKLIEKFHGKRSKDYYEALVDGLESFFDDSKYKPVHWVVSPPVDSVFTKKSFSFLRKIAYKMAKKTGFRGGAVIFHPYRLKCSVCGHAIPDYKKTCECGCVEFEWMNGPHFHVLGFGWMHDSGNNYQETGWIVRNFGVRKSVYYTFQYLLSHAGVFVDPSREGKPVSFHTTTWFGSLSYNQLKHVPQLMSFKDYCPHCGAMLVFGDEDFVKRFPPPEGWGDMDFLVN